MTVAIVMYSAAIGMLFAFAGLALEHGAAWVRQPRRWGWAAALVATMGLTLWLPWRPPLISSQVAVPAIVGPLGTFTQTVGRWWSMGTTPAMASGPAFGLQAVVTLAWALASTALLVLHGLGVLSLRRQRAQWSTAVLGKRRMLVSDGVGPAVIGFWSTDIVVPEWALRLEPGHVELLLRHEEAHQRARDPVLSHVAEVATVAMPWNPAAWWMRARLRAAIELDCDARVLAASQPYAGALPANPETYADLLLTVAARRRGRLMPLVPALIERASVLKRRILAMHPINYRLPRTRLLTAALLATVLFSAALMLPVPSVHAQKANDGPFKPGTPGLKNPVVLKSVHPTYTEAAMKAKIEGSVSMEGVVTVDGTFEDGRITKSLDTVYGLDEQALKAAKLWLFGPGTLDGKPVPVVVTLEMTFTLR